MAETKSGAPTAIVAVVAIVAILLIVWLVFLRGGAPAESAPDLEVNVGDAVESVTPE